MNNIFKEAKNYYADLISLYYHSTINPYEKGELPLVVIAPYDEHKTFVRVKVPKELLLHFFYPYLPKGNYS